MGECRLGQQDGHSPQRLPLGLVDGDSEGRLHRELPALPTEGEGVLGRAEGDARQEHLSSLLWAGGDGRLQQAPADDAPDDEPGTVAQPLRPGSGCAAASPACRS